LLPYIEQDAVYNAFNNAQTNADFNAAISTPIQAYQCPSDPRGGLEGTGTDSAGNVSQAGLTWYVGVTGSVGQYDANGTETADSSTFGILQATSPGVAIPKI